MNPSNGKGSAPRKGRDEKAYQDNWGRIFNKPKKDDDKPPK